MADVSKEKKLAALRDLAEKMGFSLTKKQTTAKKMRGGGMAKMAKKKMRGGGVMPKRMRGGGMAKMAKKKMMRGGVAKKK